jgi:hypothetical protein
VLHGEEGGDRGREEQGVGVDRPHQVEGEGVQKQEQKGEAGVGRAELLRAPPVEQHGGGEA